MYGGDGDHKSALDPYADPPPAGAAPSAAPSNGDGTRIPNGGGRGRSRSRSRSRSPLRRQSPRRSSPSYRRRSPPAPRRPTNAPVAPNPSQVLGVFGLSIRTVERDLEDEFNRHGRVEKVTIVYDQRSGRSRGFGFIRMSATEEAEACIKELNGIELNGRRIRVDYSVTDRAHQPTPGEYMGLRKSDDRYERRERGSRYDDGGKDRYSRSDRYDRDREHRGGDRERDPYGRDSRDWRDKERDRDREYRRSPRRYSPSPSRKRRSYSRSPPRGTGSSPMASKKEDIAMVEADRSSRW